MKQTKEAIMKKMAKLREEEKAARATLNSFLNSGLGEKGYMADALAEKVEGLRQKYEEAFDELLNLEKEDL